jgi:hypothetical protein
VRSDSGRGSRNFGPPPGRHPRDRRDSRSESRPEPREQASGPGPSRPPASEPSAPEAPSAPPVESGGPS